jgi:D-threo-aldose 1-dehydrogenase
VRYFDTSPWYGLGLSERRFGHFFDDKDPDEYVISTKVGRLLIPDASVDEMGLWKGDRNFRYEFDYSAEATRRSVEDSLQRMGIPKIDIVFIHDLSPDHEEALGGDWKAVFQTAVEGAMPELTRMREEGKIKAWGMGVNNIEPCLMAMEAADPDIMLCATQYSLVKHEDALRRLFPACEERDVSIVVGAPYMSGFLAGVDRYLYSDRIPEEMARKRQRLQEICREHDTDLRTASLQFTADPEVVSATIPGPRNAQQVRENVESMSVEIPSAFWETLKREGLVAENAPTPG